VHKADNLPPYCAVVTKSGSLNFSEPCGPVQACYRTVLYPIYNHNWRNISTIYIYTTRLAPSEIFSPSNKINQDVGQAKDYQHPGIFVCLQGACNLNGAWLQEVIQQHIQVFIALR
jgi:hypothetical protein